MAADARQRLRGGFPVDGDGRQFAWRYARGFDAGLAPAHACQYSLAAHTCVFRRAQPTLNASYEGAVQYEWQHRKLRSVVVAAKTRVLEDLPHTVCKGTRTRRPVAHCRTFDADIIGVCQLPAHIERVLVPDNSNMGADTSRQRDLSVCCSHPLSCQSKPARVASLLSVNNRG